MAQNPATIAIGQDDAYSDWNLWAGGHAEALPPEAGPLKRVLEHDAITQIMGEFSVADAKAVASRARYQRIGRLSLYAATLATVIGALFLLPIEAWLNGRMAAIASMLQVLSLVVAFLASRYLVCAKPFDIWMKSRAQAEIARIAYFEAVTDALEPQRAGELPLLPLAFEYFRRYQLDVQRRYYKGRAAQHAAATWRNNRWLRAGLLVTVVSVVVATLVALHLAGDAGLPVPPWLLLLPPQWAGAGPNRISLALGVVASALYGLGVARSLMDLDERNASRYATTSGNLEYLVDTGFAAAQAAAADGNAVTVKDFITQVHNQISSEHREWILLSARNARPDRLRHG